VFKKAFFYKIYIGRNNKNLSFMRAAPPTKEMAGLIEKETLNVEP
jgi:hypothetical protein